jgi:hypothetical protein
VVIFKLVITPLILLPVVADGLATLMVSITLCSNMNSLLIQCPIAIPGAVTRHEDRTLGMTRTEITCTACGGHLGHVFKGEGYDTPSEYFTFYLTLGYSPHFTSKADERHCVNSVSLNFVGES